MKTSKVKFYKFFDQRWEFIREIDTTENRALLVLELETHYPNSKCYKYEIFVDENCAGILECFKCSLFDTRTP